MVGNGGEDSLTVWMYVRISIAFLESNFAGAMKKTKCVYPLTPQFYLQELIS